MSEPASEPGDHAPAKERAEALRDAALASHGYLDSEGEILDDKIEDAIFDRVVKAVVHKTADRKAIAVTRTALTRTVVPHMPGPGDYQETDDPEAAEMAWSLVNQYVFRMCDSNAGGRVQDRLNGEHALVLCRTMATNEKGVQGVYVTRDWACLKADFVKPDQKRIERAIRRQADNAEMGVDRLPEYGKKFRRELNAVTKNVLSANVDRIDRMIESGDSDDDDPSSSDDD